MMIKYIPVFLITILFAGCAHISYRNGGIRARAPESKIKEALLVETPIGSTHEEVRNFINNRLKHLGGRFPIAERPYMASHYFNPSKKNYWRSKYNGSPEIPDLSPMFPREPRSEYDKGSKVTVILADYGRFPIGFEMVKAIWELDHDGNLTELKIEKFGL